jgi:hypothetical protein
MPEFTRFICPGCQKRFKIPAGKTAPKLCASCARVEAHISGAMPAPLEELLAAVEAERIAPIQATEPPIVFTHADGPALPVPILPPERRGVTTVWIPVRNRFREWHESIIFLMAIAGTGLWARFYRSDAPLDLLSYLGAAVALFAIVLFVRTKSSQHRRFATWIASTIAISLFAIFAFTDEQKETVETEDAWTVTSFTRWGGTPIYRDVHLSGRTDTWMHGPVSQTGKAHGKWTSRIGASWKYVWYWYGEQVSEGEWHLRNK